MPSYLCPRNGFSHLAQAKCSTCQCLPMAVTTRSSIGRLTADTEHSVSLISVLPTYKRHILECSSCRGTGDSKVHSAATNNECCDRLLVLAWIWRAEVTLLAASPGLARTSLALLVSSAPQPAHWKWCGWKVWPRCRSPAPSATPPPHCRHTAPPAPDSASSSALAAAAQSRHTARPPSLVKPRSDTGLSHLHRGRW